MVNEKRFLLKLGFDFSEIKNEAVRELSIRQTYFASNGSECSYIRDVNGSDISMFICSVGDSSNYVEIPLSVENGEQLCSLFSKKTSNKTRFVIPQGNGEAISIDLYRDESGAPLQVVVVVDAETLSSESFELPLWCGRDVSEQSQFSDEHFAI